MTLELNGRQVVVTGEQCELARTSADSVSLQGADVVIWIREWKGDCQRIETAAGKNRDSGCVTAAQPNITTYFTLASVDRWTQILLVIRLGNARTSRLTLKDFWNKNAPDW